MYKNQFGDDPLVHDFISIAKQLSTTYVNGNVTQCEVRKRDLLFKSNIPASEFEEKWMVNCSHTNTICQILVMDT